MPEITVATRRGSSVVLPPEVMETLRAGIRGTLILPDDPGYDRARAVWNAMIDRRPGLIVRCAGAADVIRAVNLAREHGLLASVRGGGHNIAGKAMCDGGMVIDLSAMRDVRVDPARRTARVGPGATLADLDHETQAFGLATPVGINSTTGIAGLTLGGGFGWLSRRHGLTVDNLISADVVTADGALRLASEKKEPDLFWGIRGGGGNLGVVTSFEFRLHKVGAEVLAGLLVYPFADAEAVLDHYRTFTADAPDELTTWVVLRHAPPLPFLPERVHGSLVVVIALLYAGGVRKGKQVVRPLRDFGRPLGDAVGPHPYTGWQQGFDPLLTPGSRNYWKSHNFAGLPDAAVQVILRYARSLPTAQSEIFLAQMGGAVSARGNDATAYPHRDAAFILNVHTRWDDPSQDAACTAWAREFFDASAPHATGGVYVNFISEGEDRVPAAYGANYERLARLKKRFDPDNLFSLNQNVRPA